jgi:hypothetical protein
MDSDAQYAQLPLRKSSRGMRWGPSASTAQMLGKCDRLRKELSRAYATSLRNAGYIQRLADEINIIERAIATSECETQLSANVAALDDEAVDRMIAAPHRACEETLAQAIVGCESKDRSGQDA